MEFAKSLFQVNSHEKEGYVGVNTVHKLALVESACDDPDGEVLICSTERTGLFQPISPKPGISFSAVTPSMWPQDLTTPNENSSITGDEVLYNEFGFRIDEEDGPEQSSNKLLGVPFSEDPSTRLQWLAQLEFSHSRDEVQDLSWDSIPHKITLSQKLWEMMTSRNGGLPHSLRPHLWSRLAKKSDEIFLPYWRIVKESTANEYFSYAKHIEKDLVRILPSNGCFAKLSSPGIPRLRRQLRALAWLYPDMGYCQGLAIVVAHLLLFLEEETSYEVMCSILQDLLPSTYFLSDFVGIRLDCLVVSHLVTKNFQNINQLLKDFDIDVTLIVFPWILTLFSSVLHVRILVRVWDLFFSEGDVVLFRVILAMLKFAEKDLLEMTSSPDIFNFLSNLPARIDDFESLEIWKFDDINKNTIENFRKELTPQVLTDGSIFTIKNGNRKIKRRTLTKPKKISRGSILSNIFGDIKGSEDVKNKNVRQTELMVDLHEAIHQIGRHFMSNDTSFMNISLEVDFSLESHEKDHERFSQGYSIRVKRAKALVDFERRDDDELGFRRNDILIVVNSKDEHCWVGELNGLRGWFPAKFVCILDERSKEYSSAGDDSVTEGIADLARGVLCPALKRIFEHGMKNPGMGPIHPWLFIEEVAAKEIERDYRSVHSRLVLCNTYKLDEDGKVLSPEEILFRCVETVNRSHEKVQMDVKLRSLISLGLNEQVLHLWIEILCSSPEVVSKWYYPWSFVNSPGWVGLKCELRVLSQFSFTLSLDWELRPLKEEKLEVKNGLRDMLVKHHLFSWNLN